VPSSQRSIIVMNYFTQTVFLSKNDLIKCIKGFIYHSIKSQVINIIFRNTYPRVICICIRRFMHWYLFI